jgi:CTP synthase (UTP-ammonia lyase)
MTSKAIALVADFNPSNQSHRATNEAIQHSLAALSAAIDVCWIGTEELARAGAAATLGAFRGVWIGPASPYKSMDGALAAIRHARECRIPLLGTCGGFQHMILEYARNVLSLTDAEHEETEPQASRLFISRLACSLVGRTMTVTLEPTSRVAALYGRLSAQEQYLCNFGVNPDYVERLRASALCIVGSDDEGAVRVVELRDHPFFVGTLFLPQLSSRPDAPHPVVSGFIKACLRQSAA